MGDTQDILMPLEQEGSKSVVRAWLKAIGDTVSRDEPLVELETDKVAVEVPAPADGVLTAIMLSEGDEAPPGATLGVLSLAAGQSERLPTETRVDEKASDPVALSLGQRLSPLVKRLLAEHDLSPSAITGSGRDGRITHNDVEAYVARKPIARPTAPARKPPATSSGKIPHDAMRRAIAEHMSRSVTVAPHVTAVFEADFSAIMAHRAKHKATYDKARIPLTFSAYIVRACAEAMKVAPTVNSRWHDDYLEVFEDINIGVGVALKEKGLIVPVIPRTQTLSLRGAAEKLGELTEKARLGQLRPTDVQGGTFTISNHGVSGSLLATPIIINQPQSAILGVGKLEKRVVVRTIDGSEAMQVRPMAYVSLTIDHRVLDGHQTNAWLTRFVEALESWPLEDVG